MSKAANQFFNKYIRQFSKIYQSVWKGFSNIHVYKTSPGSTQFYTKAFIMIICDGYSWHQLENIYN